MQIELQDIHKHYNGLRANNGISLTVKSGSIHGILGENGAGKSTLMKVLAGFIPKTSGTIRINGNSVDYRTPEAAAAHGIGMLYQEPLDFPQLSVLDNFMLGQARGLNLRRKEWLRRFRTLSEQFEFKLQPDMSVAKLTIGERQQLELLRLLAKGINTLILDEPTTGISSIQKQMLFTALRKLALEGKSVVAVSHKLEDVELLCDRVTVLNQGSVSGEMQRPYDTPTLLKMMFSKLPQRPDRDRVSVGKTIMALNRVSGLGGRTGLSDCNVVIRQGEVVGLAGLEGSGQGVFLRIACGLKSPLSGSVEIFDERLTGKNYHTFKRKGITFLPTNRLEEGLIGEMSITEHFALQQQCAGLMVPWSASLKQARECIDKFRIMGHPSTLTTSLSGGNQQRLMLSFLPKNPKLLLLENPTRGLDLESAHWIWQYLHGYLKQQTSIVFSSSELDEIIRFADRILVFFEGRIIADVKSEESCPEALGRAIAGKI